MRNHHSQHRSKIQKIASLVILAIALTIVTPVLAAYLGPDRTRTVSQTSCDVILRECQYIASKGDYRWHQVDSWSCSNESKPWLSYSNQSSGCDSNSTGDKYWSKKETVDDVLFTFPSATISGVLQNCTLKNGWCTTAPQLALTGNEPVSGYRIIGLEGTLNGQGFACPATTCAVALLEGNNSFNYWALSTWADTSLMGTLSAKVDTVKPTISGMITATSGWNGWFTSPVIFNGSASDSNPGSGLAAFTCTLDGIALASCASITINSEGPHSLVFTARDNAGQTNTFTQNASIDLQAPALNISLAGTSGSNPAWYTSAQLNSSASDTSSGSGLLALEYRLDQDSWATFPESGELTLPDGRHTVEVRATDNAGLTTSSSKTFSVDGNPPSIAIDPAGNRGANNWYVSDLSLTASASDETSGIGGLEYSLNNDSWLPYTGSLNLTDGIHEISFWATDEAGLASQVNQTYQIDTHIPGIEGSLSGVSGENGWFTSNVTLSASALDPQPGSGIDAFTYILNGSPEEYYTIPLNLPDGQHTILLNARDNAGLSYTMEQTVNVDTLPPTLDIQTVLPNWVKETVALDGSTLDEGSGLSTLEISTDGGQTWQAVTGTTSWSHSWDTSESPSGSTEVMVRAIDKAGLIARKTLRTGVDNKAPVISLPASWFQWDTIDLDIQEEHSGLSEASLEISDPQGGGPARIIALDSATFPMQFKWDRRFADGTTAPEGKYDFKVTATDNLGNTATGNASITILLNLPPGPTATNIPTNRPPASPTISYTATAIPANTGTPTVAVKGFGSTLVPQATATPKPGTTSTPRVTPTQNKVVEWFESIIPSQLDATLKTTEISSLGVPAPTTNSGSNVLWGATAAAVMGSLTAYALEERRRQQEEKIQQEEKEKQAERDRQAEKARQRALEAKDEERRDKTKDKQMAKLEVKWAQERAWEEARKAKEKEQEARYQAHMEARVLGREIAEETKRVAEEKAERERIEEKKRAEEKKEAQHRQAAIAASYATLLQKENEAPPQESNWWEKTKSFIGANIIQPLNTSVYQPYIKPVVELREQFHDEVAGWANKTINQPYIQPALEGAKQFLNDASEWAEEKKNVLQEHIAFGIENTKTFLASEGSWISQQIYHPYIKPVVEKSKEILINATTRINESIYQPYIKPVVERTEKILINEATRFNESIYQPYIKPVVKKTEQLLVAGSSLINEKIVQPIKSVVNASVEGLRDGISWINQNIYQPIFEPVVSDINKYIYKPLADKTEAWWGEYGEWVHNSLDVVGFIPGLGDIADGLNGLVYLGEGRYIEAGVSALAMVPIIGDLGKAGKWSLKLGTELAEEAAEEVIEKTFQEGLEEITEKATEEVVEDFVEQGAKEGLEQISEEYFQRTLKEAIPGTVTKLPTEIAENLTQESAAELAEKMTKELGGTKVWVSAEKGTIYISKAPDGGFALAKEIKETDLTNKEQVRNILRQIAEQTSRGSGNHVVLGPFGKNGDFIQAALDTDGIFWDVGDDLWKEIQDTGIDMYDLNHQFLELHVENGINRFDVVQINPSEIIDNFNTSPTLEWNELKYREKEVLDLATMPNTPYELVDNSWIRSDLVSK